MTDTTPTDTPHVDDWIPRLRTIYDRAVLQYERGRRDPDQVIDRDALAFLDSIGTSARELYDFVEEWVDDGEPDFDTVAAITGVRRSYFLTVQQGRPSDRQAPPALPSGYAELGGYRWLPRIIAKARAKLRGELSPETMFGCSTDRPFLRSANMEPAEFLNIVWEAGADDHLILEAVRQRAAPTPIDETCDIRRAT